MIAETDDPLGGSMTPSNCERSARAHSACGSTPDSHGRTVATRRRCLRARPTSASSASANASTRSTSAATPSTSGPRIDASPTTARATYAPLPVLMSSRGYGFALERFERSRFDLAAAKPDRWTWQQDAPAASAIVSYGPTLKDLVQRNAELHGLPPLPPRWLVWRLENAGRRRRRRHRRDEAPARPERARSRPCSSSTRVDSDANLGWPIVTFAGRRGRPVSRSRGFHQRPARSRLQGPELLHRRLPHRSQSTSTSPPRTASSSGDPTAASTSTPGFRSPGSTCTDPDAVMWWARLVASRAGRPRATTAACSTWVS